MIERTNGDRERQRETQKERGGGGGEGGMEFWEEERKEKRCIALGDGKRKTT